MLITITPQHHPALNYSPKSRRSRTRKRENSWKDVEDLKSLIATKVMSSMNHSRCLVLTNWMLGLSTTVSGRMDNGPVRVSRYGMTAQSMKASGKMVWQAVSAV